MKLLYQQSQFEIFFFSCGESYSEKHFLDLEKKCPQVKRIMNFNSTVAAWTHAAEVCKTSHFFSVDADNIVSPDFSWTVPDFLNDDPRIHVWRCQNPVNGLVYGHGAIKLWSVKNILSQKNKSTWIDFTCQLSTYGFKIQPELASVAHFNSCNEETFKSAYKECLKLASGETRYALTADDPELEFRLKSWTHLGRNATCGVYSILGARMAIRDILMGAAENKSIYLADWRQQLWEQFKNNKNQTEIERQILTLGEELSGLGFKITELTTEQDLFFTRNHEKFREHFN